MTTAIASSVQEHATIVGGSSAERVINCPGSVRLIAKSPKQPTSQAAMDGTAQHAVTEHILLNGGKPIDYLGAVVDNVTIDEDKVKNVEIALASSEELLAPFMDGETFVEQVVEHTPVEAFGTGDLMAISKDGKRLLIADHKFGYVEVEPDNYQGRFLASVAINDHRPLDDSGAADAPTLSSMLIDVEWVDLAIIQPSFDPAHTVVTFPREEFDTFFRTLEVAITQAKSPNAPVREGDWCKWCTAHLICPAKRERNADLIDLKKHDPAWGTAVHEVLDVGAWFLPLHDKAKERAKHELENGQKIAGWKLGTAKARYSWIDKLEKNILASLRGLGFKETEIVKPITPAAARKLVTKNDEGTAKLLEEMISKGYDAAPLVREDDPSAPAIPVAAIKRAATAAAARSAVPTYSKR